MKKLLQYYIDSFKGLSKAVWFLALITLINRAGTMVIPFLSLYLNQYLSFTLPQVGWVLSSFGLGSLVGSWLGGRLTDRIGYYKTMVVSLLLSAFLFVGLQFLTTIWMVCAGVVILMAAADAFRPAVFVALSAYSKPENRTRSLSLIRLAINLGFSAGPAIGGLIITTMDYGGLFWIDGVTCLVAGMLLMYLLHPKKAKEVVASPVTTTKTAYQDKTYWVFLMVMVLFGFMFLQYFSTIPLYYKEIHQLSEFQIGLLMGGNGFLIFLVEMPAIKYLEQLRMNKLYLILVGCLLTALSFLVLNMTDWSGILIVGMLLMTFGEMVVFPFSNAFASARAAGGNPGSYMGLYTMSFSIAHIVGHNGGMQLIHQLGFFRSWFVILGVGILSCTILLYLINSEGVR